MDKRAGFRNFVESTSSLIFWKSDDENKPKIPKVHITHVLKNPLESLTPQQQILLEKLKEISNQWKNEVDEEEFNWLTDETLFRFLKGKKFNLKDASDSLHQTVKWRYEFKPKSLKEDPKISNSNYLFHTGFDRQSRPICYILLGRDNIENTIENQKLKFNHLVLTMEQCISNMKPNVINTCFVIDLKNANINLDLINQMKDMFSKLGGYYTERLGICLITNCSFSMSFLWEVVKNFLPQETLSKYIFITGDEEEISEQFDEYIEKNELIKYFGGTNLQ